MDLSRLSIEPRLRNGWQAIDLGFVMARRWWWPCFLAWALPSFLCYVLLSLLLYNKPFIALLLVWWLKPLWDRLPLLIASRRLFAEPMGLWEALRQPPKLAKTDLFAWLVYRRISLSRSFDMPVTVLEGLRKEARGKRLALLHQTYGNAAFWLTLVCVHVEMFISFGFTTILLMLIPPELRESGAEVFLFSESLPIQHAANFIMWLAMAVVAPFYCLAGFSLYINRRIQLEGWDIEVRFRHLLARHGSDRKISRVAACLAALGFGGLMLLPDSSWAESTPTPEFVDNYYHQLSQDERAIDSKQGIIEVLRGPDFYYVEMEPRWRLKGRQEVEERDLDWIDRIIDLLEGWYELTTAVREGLKKFAGLFEVAVWLLLGLLIAYVVYKYRRGFARMFRYWRAAEPSFSKPELLFGLDVRTESLPDDVCSEVVQLWDAGREREAVALLYRATLSSLIHQYSFEFYAGFTEQECMAVVERGNNSALSQYVEQLTRLWQRLAYAHQLPERAQVIALCTGWQELFEEASHAA